jgi:hypothetical protein
MGMSPSWVCHHAGTICNDVAASIGHCVILYRPTVFGVPHSDTKVEKAVPIHGRGSHELGLDCKPFEGVRPVITDVVSTLKNMLDRLDNEIEEHTRQRDFYFAALANETESPARTRVLSSVMLHTKIVHTLWGISDRHDVCPCGMCDQKALMILKAALRRHAGRDQVWPRTSDRPKADAVHGSSRLPHSAPFVRIPTSDS